MPSATEKSTEKIKEFKVEMYNANKEVKELGNLVDTFDELDKKVFKTAEDLKEMDTILAKIAEYGGDENMFVVGGQIDRKAVDDYLKGQQEIADAAQAGIRAEGKDNVARMQRGAEQTPETRASIIEYLASSTAGFDELDKAVQDRIRFAISQDIEGYAEAFKTTEVITNGYNRGALRTTYENTIKPEAQKMLKDFNGLFTGELEGDAAAELFEAYTLLDPSDKKMIEDAYANQLGDILLVGEEVIDNFLNRGYNLGQIASIVATVEDALSGLSVGFNYGNSQGGGFMETANASDVADFYAETLSTLDPSDPNSNAQALNATIQYIEELGLSAADTQKYVKQLTDVLTDPMAFKTGMNEVRRATSSIEALMDASKSMADGKLPDNLETLVETYPQLAGQLRDGTLTMTEAYDAVASELGNTLTGKLNDLYSQLATASEAEKAAIQAQIDILEYYKNNPQLLMNEEGMVDEQVKEMEDRYKSEIDFIKSLNSARKEEIDLMQRKLDVNKSMLDIDRQISALSRDTSYGAQARLRDLRENQASEALEREKFIMDLITEQAISQLEEESRQAVLKINDNVQAIVEALTSPSSPTNRTADTVRQEIGLTLREN